MENNTFKVINEEGKDAIGKEIGDYGAEGGGEKSGAGECVRE